MTDTFIGSFEARLLLAFLLGACIGMERQVRHKLAGVKTNSLVAGGAALFILLSEKIIGDATSTARIAAQIVTGIGFLGAGIIMREGLNVSGLNTSATIWCSGAIGTMAGLGFWYESSVGAAFVIIAHLVLQPISNRLDRRISKIVASGNRYLLKIKVENGMINQTRTVVMETLHNVETLHITSIETDTESTLQIVISSLDKRQSDIEGVVKILSGYEHIQSVGWEAYTHG